MSKEIKNFPSDAEIKRVLKKLRHVKGAYPLPPNPTEVERVKYSLCEQMVIYVLEHDLTQRQLAKKLKVAESRISGVLRYHLDTISIDKLVELHERLKRKVTVSVA